MNPQTPATPAPADDDIPAFLKDNAQKAQAAREAAKPAAKAAEPKPAAPVKAKADKPAAKAAEPKPAGNRVAKAAKPAAPAKAKAKAKHKPSDIVRTDANPAKSIVPVRFKEAYKDHDGTNGDEVAYAVTAAITEKNADGRTVLSDVLLKKLAEDNGIDYSKYSHLNMGQRSMNVRNRLRGILKSGKTITVGKRKFADKAKALAKRPVAEAEATA